VQSHQHRRRQPDRGSPLVLRSRARRYEPSVPLITSTGSPFAPPP